MTPLAGSPRTPARCLASPRRGRALGGRTASFKQVRLCQQQPDTGVLDRRPAGRRGRLDQAAGRPARLEHAQQPNEHVHRALDGQPDNRLRPDAALTQRTVCWRGRSVRRERPSRVDHGGRSGAQAPAARRTGTGRGRAAERWYRSTRQAICSRSAFVSSGRSTMRVSGSATAASSSVTKCPIIRSTVSGSKRSLLYPSCRSRRRHPRRARASGRRWPCRCRSARG